MNTGPIEGDPEHVEPTAVSAEAPSPPRVAETRSAPSMAVFLWRTARRVRAIFRDPSNPRAGELARDFVRLKLRQRLLRRFPGLERKHESFLGLRVEVFDYWTFVYLFEEVFVGGDYRFDSKTAEPRILDCGSNIGLSTLYFKQQYPNARILGFECDPQTFELLRRNVRANGLSDVEVRNEALFPGKDRVALYRDPNWLGAPFMSLDRSLVARLGSSDGKVVPHSLVPATVLSRHVNEPVDFLKMDIEGAEVPVLEELGASGKLPLIGQMVLEFHHHIDPRVDQLGRLLALFEQNGFGYQLRAPLEGRFSPGGFQNLLIYAYRR